jgi:hypothetical protein
MKKHLCLLASLFVLGGSQAFAATYDFESTSTGTGLTSLSQTDSGLTMTLTRSGGSSFGIASIGGSFGSRTLEPFSGGFAAGAVFVADFSSSLSAFSAQFTDFNADDDTPVFMTAWSGAGGTGLILDTDSAVWVGSASVPSFGTLSVSAAGIGSVTFSNGGSFANSLYWDNMSATAGVPETASTVLLLGAALLTLAARRRLS